VGVCHVYLFRLGEGIYPWASTREKDTEKERDRERDAQITIWLLELSVSSNANWASYYA
jgi:hypothetical protein